MPIFRPKGVDRHCRQSDHLRARYAPAEGAPVQPLYAAACAVS